MTRPVPGSCAAPPPGSPITACPARGVLTNNARVYRAGRGWTQACAELGISRRFTRPHYPWTNGKVERFNRTLLDEFA
ncbi:hypothetical protein DMP15_28740 [Pseudonocardia sp. UM4_GMWB1]|nr:transposase family protein [Pseudonocardia alni]